MTRSLPNGLITSICLLVALPACSLLDSGESSKPFPPTQAQAAPVPRPVPPTYARALVGDRPDAVEAALGPPVLRHNEGPAEVWLYATAEGCRVDLVLYRDQAGPRVAHADARTPAHMTETACLHAIANQPS